MALNKTTLANQIKAALDSAYTKAQNKNITQEQVKTEWANAIADAFDTYVKTMQITIPPGTIVVSGSAVTQSNAAPILVVNSVS